MFFLFDYLFFVDLFLIVLDGIREWPICATCINFNSTIIICIRTYVYILNETGTKKIRRFIENVDNRNCGRMLGNEIQ